MLFGSMNLAAEEAAEYESERFELVNHDTSEGATLVCKGTGNYNEFWYDRGFGDSLGERRTSLIIDPPNGRVPALTPEAARRGRQVRGTDSWESRGIAERCIAGFNTGPPMMPSAYNNYVQLIQTSDYVVVFSTFDPNTGQQWPFGDNVKWQWMVNIGELDLNDYVNYTEGVYKEAFLESTLFKLMYNQPTTEFTQEFVSENGFVLIYSVNEPDES